MGMSKCSPHLAKAKRQRVGGVAPPPPPSPTPPFDVDDFVGHADPPEHWPSEEDGAAESACLQGDLHDPSCGMSPTVAAARKLARQLLLHPQWPAWADGLVDWCEHNFLRDVGSLFPAEQDYINRATYRYLRLKAMWPGASFHKKLLEEDKRETLLLSEVTHSPRGAYMVIARRDW